MFKWRLPLDNHNGQPSDKPLSPSLLIPRTPKPKLSPSLFLINTTEHEPRNLTVLYNFDLYCEWPNVDLEKLFHWPVCVSNIQVCVGDKAEAVGKQFLHFCLLESSGRSQMVQQGHQKPAGTCKARAFTQLEQSKAERATFPSKTHPASLRQKRSSYKRVFATQNRDPVGSRSRSVLSVIWVLRLSKRDSEQKGPIYLSWKDSVLETIVLNTYRVSNWQLTEAAHKNQKQHKVYQRDRRAGVTDLVYVLAAVREVV